MICSRHVYAGLFCLAASGLLVALDLHAQGQGAGGPSPTGVGQQNSGLEASGGLSAQEVQALASERTRHRQWANTTSTLWMNNLKSIPQLREMLAREWQRMGVPADQATVIAAAYRGDQDRLVQHAPLQGRSAQEIASMLQSALDSKDYRLANQLLIDYERDQLGSGPGKDHP